MAGRIYSTLFVLTDLGFFERIESIRLDCCGDEKVEGELLSGAGAGAGPLIPSPSILGWGSTP